MEFSVIICTLNRSAGLALILQSLSKQRFSKEINWEIIVVDNNSTDNTKDVVNSFAYSSNLNVKYVKETTIGLSHARNRGIVEADGRFVLFLEDDEIADRDLIDDIYKTFISYNCQCVCGRIKLRFEDKVPSWLTKELYGFLGHLDYGRAPLLLDEEHYPFGGNMAFSKAIFINIGLFNVKLGRKGQKLFGGEEVDLFLRLLRSGQKGIYQPSALVFHRINRLRLKRNYFRRLHYNSGLQRGLLNELEYNNTIYGVPIFLFPQFLKRLINTIRIIFLKGYKRSLYSEMILLNFLGFMKGLYLNRKIDQ